MKTALVTSSDDAFALPVTVMLRSIVDHLGGVEAVDIFVLDCGLSSGSRRKMLRSISGGWAHIQFIPVKMDSLTGFRVDGHISAATYARLLLEKHLPDSLERVIYLDGDMLFLADIKKLMEIDLKGHPVAAVQDPVAGIVGQSAQMMHWGGWDVPDGTQVFNAGLMVIDLCRWRKESIFEQAIQVARKYPDRMKFWDQCALNYVIRGDFEPLDPAWNVLPFLNYLPHSKDVIYSREIMDRCIDHPKGIHFGGTWRPWKGPGRHWKEVEFYRYLYRTAWRNEVYCAPWMGRGNSMVTKWKRMLKDRISGAPRT